LKLNIKTTILSYILIIYGLYYFILRDNKSLKDAFILGIFVYGVYELVSISLLSNWEYKTVLIDTLWGGFLFMTSIYITRKIL
jgi:uncharacterized membrane protein